MSHAIMNQKVDECCLSFCNSPINLRPSAYSISIQFDLSFFSVDLNVIPNAIHLPYILMLPITFRLSHFAGRRWVSKKKKWSHHTISQSIRNECITTNHNPILHLFDRLTCVWCKQSICTMYRVSQIGSTFYFAHNFFLNQ